MKKIYFLINELSSGGAQRVILNISRRLAYNNKITIITLKNDVFFDLPPNIEHISLSRTNNNFIMLLLFPYYIIKFKKLLKEKKYDFGMSSLEFSNFINILSNSKSVICLEISLEYFKGFSGKIYYFFMMILYPLASQIKVNSYENKKDLVKEFGILDSKVEVIYNPLDMNEIRHLSNIRVEKRILNQIKNKKVFITVGRLVWQKYHIKILEGFTKVIKKDKNFIYLIVGDGPEKSSLEKYVKDNSLDNNVIFLGNQSNVFKYLRISNYCVYASEIEGFPNVLGEAMALKLPIITSHFRTGSEEIVFGKFTGAINKYPIKGDNGILLSNQNFAQDFYNTYLIIESITQKQTILKNLDIDNIINKIHKKMIMK